MCDGTKYFKMKVMLETSSDLQYCGQFNGINHQQNYVFLNNSVCAQTQTRREGQQVFSIDIIRRVCLVRSGKVMQDISDVLLSTVPQTETKSNPKNDVSLTTTTTERGIENDAHSTQLRLRIGDKVLVDSDGLSYARHGCVRFIGCMNENRHNHNDGIRAEVIGVELDNAIDGSGDGDSYFRCKPGHAYFTVRECIRKNAAHEPPQTLRLRPPPPPPPPSPSPSRPAPRRGLVPKTNHQHHVINNTNNIHRIRNINNTVNVMNYNMNGMNMNMNMKMNNKYHSKPLQSSAVQPYRSPSSTKNPVHYAESIKWSKNVKVFCFWYFNSIAGAKTALQDAIRNGRKTSDAKHGKHRVRYWHLQHFWILSEDMVVGVGGCIPLEFADTRELNACIERHFGSRFKAVVFIYRALRRSQKKTVNNNRAQASMPVFEHIYQGFRFQYYEQIANGKKVISYLNGVATQTRTAQRKKKKKNSNASNNGNQYDNDNHHDQFVCFMEQTQIPNAVNYIELFDEQQICDIRLLPTINDDQTLKEIGIENKFHRILLLSCIDQYLSSKTTQRQNINKT